MTTDKTPAPLATAKHGGCVQLGDGLTIEKRAREMLAAQFDTNGPCAKTAMTAQDTYTMGAVRALINALSAQPSPGGQGDAREIIEEFLQCATSGRPHGKLIAQAKDYLAARQPVGEPVAVVTTSERFAYGKLNRDLPDGTKLFAAPPAQAVDLPYSLDADPAGIRARVADVITGTLMVGAQGHSPPPAGHWAEPFWQAARADAKAQAVDLGQFRAQVAELLRSEFDLEVADPEDHRHDDGAGEADRIASKIAALLDSQAVGNG